jgi:hypothetical protein
MVPINVYEGDRPVCQCHTAIDAKRIVDAMNGLRGVAQVSKLWGDPNGNVRRMEGEQEIIATITKECSDAEWKQLCDSGDGSDRERRVAEWIRTRIGEVNLQPRERAMRILEEAIELAQAEGITHEQVQRQAGYVFSRSAGDPLQEASGIAICLLGWCAATENTFDALADAEITRIEEKPIDQIRGSLARKADADLVCTVDESEGKP